MNHFYKAVKKVKVFGIIAALSIAAFCSSAYVDNYFEISKNLDIFYSLFKELNIRYVDDTNPGQLVKTGIDAMLGSLDPYTNYITESDIENYRFVTTGQYGGIGASINKIGEYIVVSEPYEGYPAQKAGLIAGDVILKVDGKDVVGKTTSEMSTFLKGQPGTEIVLLIKRPGNEEPIEKRVNREVIKVKDVPYYGMVNDKVGYIKLTGFTQTASREAKEAFIDLRDNEGMESLIFDLRGNGGGLLREAVNIVNFFVEKGSPVVTTKGKDKEMNSEHKALNSPLDLSIPLVILIDEGSASASEIVSGAIQDLDRGVLIGNRSFGKGLVQQTVPLKYNAQLKITIAKYYIPSGRCIQRLDYFNKSEDGKVSDVPDSLVTPFKTKNGRPVFDGKGILPDIEVDVEYASNITQTLISKMLIFEYATLYHQEHDSIDNPKNFHLTDSEYNDFVSFLKDKEYDYNTRSEKVLEDLKKMAKKEQYYEAFEKEYTALQEKMKRNKDKDLIRFKGEVTRFLENEIVSRYYYQNGRIEASLAIDEDIAEALKVLGDQSLYVSILDGSYTDEATKD